MHEHWTLDTRVTFLNHGSFGACPRRVIERQARLREELERNPVRFMQGLSPRLDAVREQVAALVRAQPDEVAFVRNATEGVNAVLRSLRFSPDDELLTTDHTYAACRHALDFVAARSGARVVVARVPFPSCSAEQVVAALVSAVSERTRLVLVDHVTSITGMVWPVRDIALAMNERGIDTLVDGAHAIGMFDVDLPSIGAAYYAANFHKWVCAPKGAGMLWVRRDRQAGIYPGVISHGYGAPSAQRFIRMFDWTGTDDPSAVLCVPEALATLTDLMGSLDAVAAHNRALALRARDCLCTSLGVEAPVPDEMLGSLVSIPLPRAWPLDAPADDLQLRLAERGFEVLALPWPSRSARVLRVSAQLYNRLEQYQSLAAVLPQVLAAEGDQPPPEFGQT